jgi:DNA anti-recombination protein RmuC
MEAMRVNWTDDRLDALSGRMVDRFDRVDQRFKQVDERFKQVDERFDRVEADLREMRSELNLRFDRMQQTLFVTGGGIIAALLGVIATQV